MTWQNNAMHTEPPIARFANGECFSGGPVIAAVPIANPASLQRPMTPTDIELLTCPNCTTTIRSSKTVGVADSKTVTCKKCELKSSLGEWRLHAPDNIDDAELPAVRHERTVSAPSMAQMPPEPPSPNVAAAQTNPSQHVVVNNYLQANAIAPAQPQYIIVGQRKSRAVAIILALLLGGLGAHHFYRGNLLLGILYLLFFWTFIPAMIALVEAIYYACIDDNTFNGVRVA